MRRFNFLAQPITACAIVVVLASACGQPTASTLPIHTHTFANPQGVLARPSMQLDRADMDLLYVSSADGNVYVYSYPQGTLVQALTGFITPLGECVDSAGNVFITAYANYSFNSSTIYEYPHGGTSPILTLNDPGTAYGCAVDASTGNLAVANTSDNSNPYKKGYGDIAVYAQAKGSPTMYYDPDFPTFYYYCGYDPRGNLYASAAYAQNEDKLLRLPRSGTTIEPMKLNKNIYGSFDFEPSVQWDGRNMTVSTVPKEELHLRGLVSVYRLKILGNTATVVGTTRLSSKKNHHGGQSWIQGRTIAGIDFFAGYGNVSFWPYPAGGMPEGGILKIAPRTGGELWGVTVSRGRPAR